MRNADLKKISEDMALNSDAVRVVIFVESRGKGKHPISNDRFRTILHMAGPKKVSLALRLAESSGWISRTKGGWGSPDFYEFNPKSEATVTAETEGTGDLFDPAKMEGTAKPLSPPKWKAQGTDPAKTEGTTRTREIRKRERVIESSKEKGGSGGGDPCALDPRVDERLSGERWGGFRNALKDYFKSRVTTGNQWGYLMTVETWFDGASAGPKGFFNLKPKDQRLLIASAVNELLSVSPTDEKLGYLSSRGIAGNPLTLKTKLEYYIRRHEQEERMSDTNGRKPGDGKPQPFVSKDGIGSNQPEFFPEDLEGE